MSGVFITALCSSFFLVRLVKGNWSRYPAHVALAIFGGMAALIILMKFSPGLEDSLIAGNIAALGGALATMMLYDFVVRTATK